MSLPPIPPASTHVASTSSSSASSSSHLPPRPSHLPAPPTFVTAMPDLAPSGRDNVDRYTPAYDSRDLRENGGRGAGQSRDYDAGGECSFPSLSSPPSLFRDASSCSALHGSEGTSVSKLTRPSSPRSTRLFVGWFQIARGEGHLHLSDEVEIENQEMEEDPDTKMLEETLVSGMSF